MRQRLLTLAAVVLCAAHTSAPQAGAGELLTLQVHAPSLAGNLVGDAADRTVHVYLPSSYAHEPERRYPVLVLLHGYCPTCVGSLNDWWISDDYYSGDATRLYEEAVAGRPEHEMILVFPDNDNAFRGSFYTNSSTTGSWTDFVALDLVAYMDANFRTVPDRTQRGVAGHSMGGHGAAKVAYMYPDVFGAVYVMAGAFGMERPPDIASDDELLSWGALLQAVEDGVDRFGALPAAAHFPVTYGAAVAPNPDNPPFFMDYLYRPNAAGQLELVEDVWQRWLAADPVELVLRQPGRIRELDAIYLDCGLQDDLLADSRAMSAALTSARIPHVFEEFRGTHTSGVRAGLAQRVFPFFGAYFSHGLPLLASGSMQLPPRLAGSSALDVQVELVGPVQASGAFPELLLDATSAGLGDMPLRHDGNGHYTLAAGPLELPSGRHAFPVHRSGDPLPLLISRVEVHPRADLVVTDDEWGAGWSVAVSGGAAEPDFTTDGPRYQGVRSLALRVEPASWTGWRVQLAAPAPVSPFGYSAVRLAFHPGSATGRSLNLMVGAQSLGLVVRRGTSLVDLSRPEWQVVEIPIEALGLIGDIDLLGFNGDLEGTFYVDDLRLVAGAAPPLPPTAVVAAEAAAVPAAAALLAAYPNPFNSTVAIRFVLPRRAAVRLDVYDIAGQRVATLVHDVLDFGVHVRSWDTHAGGGLDLATGTYVLRLVAGGQVCSRKVLLLR